MEKEVMDKIFAIIAKAKAEGRKAEEYKLASGRTSSLGKVITSQKKADAFMAALRAE